MLICRFGKTLFINIAGIFFVVLNMLLYLSFYKWYTGIKVTVSEFGQLIYDATIFEFLQFNKPNRHNLLVEISDTEDVLYHWIHENE